MNRLRLAVGILALALLTAPSAGAHDERFEPVREEIRRAIAGGIPSIAVAVIRDGRIVWEEGFGWADRERRIPATAHTMYSLASISKPITATALMTLVEDGKLVLDRPINDYLGPAQLNIRVGDPLNATIRRIANHSAGLGLHYQFFYEDDRRPPPPMAETIRRYGNVVTAPGERYQYSNLGYGLLGHVIGETANLDYEDFMRETVFLPLGMAHSAVETADSGAGGNRAVRYGGNGDPIPFYDFDHRGASAIYSSVHDLALFALFHLKAPAEDQSPILSDSAIDAMQEPTIRTGAESGYGIGWATGITRKGFRTVGHTGGMPGVTTSLVLIPSERTAVVVLSNSSNSAPLGISRQILVALGLEDRDFFRSGAQTAAALQPGSDLAGVWDGFVEMEGRRVPIQLSIQASEAVHVRLGSEPERVLYSAEQRGGFLHGVMVGAAGGNGRAAGEYLTLELKRRGDLLNGGLTVISSKEHRLQRALTYWVQLARE